MTIYRTVFPHPETPIYIRVLSESIDIGSSVLCTITKIPKLLTDITKDD